MNPQPGWHHGTRAGDRHTTVTLSGEIDMSGAGQLQDLLQQAVHGAEAVTVDVADAGFIDSTVISALVAARNTAHSTGRRFTLINPDAQVRRVLQITGILDTLTEARPGPS
ncbi:STAS domain-containing protein [Actinoplanes sp. NPDC051475]|uniref:STAS domain-containing protein n=1 Tax=Actinoplanes sp. NPDC051475 TaxID=3157225 RepID=UPI003450E941